MQSYHSAHTPLRRATSFSHFPAQSINEQVMAGATPYMGPEEIYPQPGPGSYYGSLGLNGMGMASPYPQHGMLPQGGYMGGPYMEGGPIGSPLSGDFPSSPSNIIPLSSQHTDTAPYITPNSPSRNININNVPGTHQDHSNSDSYDEYDDGYTRYGRSSYHRPRRMSSASRYYPEYDDHYRNDRSPYDHSSRYYDRGPHRSSSSRYYDRYNRYDRDHDYRYSTRHYTSGGHGSNGESIMYRRTSKGDVQVLRNGRESIGDKVRRAVGLDPKGVNVVRLKPGESVVDPRARHY